MIRAHLPTPHCAYVAEPAIGGHAGRRRTGSSDRSRPTPQSGGRRPGDTRRSQPEASRSREIATRERGRSWARSGIPQDGAYRRCCAGSPPGAARLLSNSRPARNAKPMMDAACSATAIASRPPATSIDRSPTPIAVTIEVASHTFHMSEGRGPLLRHMVLIMPLAPEPSLWSLPAVSTVRRSATREDR